jgi:hypothetical protein
MKPVIFVSKENVNNIYFSPFRLYPDLVGHQLRHAQQINKGNHPGLKIKAAAHLSS